MIFIIDGKNEEKYGKYIKLIKNKKIANTVIVRGSYNVLKNPSSTLNADVVVFCTNIGDGDDNTFCRVLLLLSLLTDEDDICFLRLDAVRLLFFFVDDVMVFYIFNLFYTQK